MNNILFVDCRVPRAVSDLISSSGAEAVRVPFSSELDEPIASHPDILLFSKNGHLIMGEKYYADNKSVFSRFADRIVLDPMSPRSPYPNDIIFDALDAGSSLICLEKHTSEKIKSLFPEIINTKQGYARCSAAKLNENCYITSDTGIVGILRAAGKKVLEITPGGISLPGYGYGFIGGAGGILPDGSYLFFGDPLSHPDGEKIISFAEMNKIKTVAIEGLPLTDCGGIVSL